MIPGLGRSPRVGHGNPLQCFCLENPVDRGAWWTAVHGVTQSRTQWSSSQYCDFRGPRWAAVTHSVSLETGILGPESKGLRSHPLSPAAQLFIPLVTNVLLRSAQVLPEKGCPGLSGEEKMEAPFPLNVELQGTHLSKSTAQVLPLQCQPPSPSLNLLPAQVSFLLCFCHLLSVPLSNMIMKPEFNATPLTKILSPIAHAFSVSHFQPLR